MEFSHSLPSPSGYCLIAVPDLGAPISDYVKTPRCVAVLKCHKSGATYNVEIHDAWRLSASDEIEANLITAWAKLAYGITGPQLLNAMRKKYQSMTTNVMFLLIKPL